MQQPGKMDPVAPIGQVSLRDVDLDGEAIELRYDPPEAASNLPRHAGYSCRKEANRSDTRLLMVPAPGGSRS